MRRATRLLLTAAFILAAAQLATAAVPPLINYQGILRDSAGAVVRDSAYTVTFRIFPTETGGSPLWEEGQMITTKGGGFIVLLGAMNPILESHFAGDTYLEVELAGGPALSPRTRLASVGYAFKAANSDKVGGLSPSELVYPGSPANVFRAYDDIPPGESRTLFGPTGRVREITGIWSTGQGTLRIGGGDVMLVNGNWSSYGGAPIQVQPTENVQFDCTITGGTFVTITGFEY